MINRAIKKHPSFKKLFTLMLEANKESESLILADALNSGKIGIAQKIVREVILSPNIYRFIYDTLGPVNLIGVSSPEEMANTYFDKIFR